jgi:outer membrane protein assembly factor BamD
MFDHGRCWTRVLLLAMLATSAAACHSTDRDPTLPPPGTVNPDQFLFQRGTDAMAHKHYLEAREYFRKIVDSYPQSQLRQESKLGMGDSYLKESRIDSDILAVNQYKEFLQFFPTHPKDDYAQFQVCVAQSRQMLSAERDQSATRQTITETDVFLQRYPGSPYKADVEKIRRMALDRLSDHEMQVGLFNFRLHAFGGATDRFNYLLAHDPDYTRRDEVYYYLAESLLATKLQPAALPYFEKVVKEFPNSKYFEASKKRLAEIKR